MVGWDGIVGWNCRMGLLPRLCDGFDGAINFATGSTGLEPRPTVGFLQIVSYGLVKTS